MGFLFGGSKKNASKHPDYTGLQVQTSAYGLPICLCYGMNRIAPNLIWYDGFKAIAKNNPNSGGGKGGSNGGGGKGGNGNVSYTYQADVLLALCEGPITGVNNVWVSQTQSTPAAEGMTVIDGTAGQAPWSFLSTNFPSAAVGYSKIAQVGLGPANLGSNAQLPNWNVEVQGLLYGTAPNGIDADPSQVINDLLTNSDHGAEFPASRWGTLVEANEAHTVPNSGPFTITVTQASAYEFNLDVVDSNGNVYQCVATNPGNQEYTYTSGGVYTFSSVNAGASITINYAYLTWPLDFQNFTLAAGLFISPFYTQQTACNQMMNDLSKNLYGSFVWSSGVLNVVPRATIGVTGNGHTYTPPASPLFSLTDDDFLPNTNATGTSSASSNADPVILTRSRPSDQINDIKLEFYDRTNQYAISVAEIVDQAQLDKFGRRASPSSQAHLFCLTSAANTSAFYQMQDEYIRNQYSFTTDQRYAMLDPMDIIAITDSGLGLNAQWVRILEITENDDGTLSFTAEEYPTGTGAPPTYTLNAGTGYVPNYNQSPGNVNTPMIFTLATQLTGGVDVVGIAASGSSSVWAGYDVWMSTDNSTFQFITRHYGPARMGVLTADFPTHTDPDESSTCSVDLSESFGQIDSTNQSGADNYNTLCYVGGEYISYETAVLTATYKYNLGAIPAPAAPTLSQTAGGTLASQTMYVKITYVDSTGETVASTETGPFTVSANNLLVVTSPTGTYPGVTGWNVYVSHTTGTETKQNTTAIAIGTNWTEPTSGLISGAALPGSNTTGYIRRGVYGSTIADHPLGTGFTRIDDGLCQVVLPSQYQGKTIYVKLASFNIWDGGLQDVSGLTAFTFSPTGSGGGPLAAPTGFTVTSSLRGNLLKWTNATGTVLAGTEVWRNTTNNLGTATLEAEVAQPGNSWTDAGLSPNTTYYYWLIPVDDSGNTGPNVSSNGTTSLAQTSDYASASVTNPVIASSAVGTTNIQSNAVSNNNGAVSGAVIINASSYTTIGSTSVTLGAAATCTIVATTTLLDGNGNAGQNVNWRLVIDGVAYTPSSFSMPTLNPGNTPTGASANFAASYTIALAAGSHSASLQMFGGSSNMQASQTNVSILGLKV